MEFERLACSRLIFVTLRKLGRQNELERTSRACGEENGLGSVCCKPAPAPFLWIATGVGLPRLEEVARGGDRTAAFRDYVNAGSIFAVELNGVNRKYHVNFYFILFIYLEWHGDCIVENTFKLPLLDGF